VNSEQDQGFAEPSGPPEQASVPFTPPESAAASSAPPRPQGPPSPLTTVVERSKAQLLQIEGVHGVAEGRTPIGDDAVRVDIDDDSIRPRLPNEIEGYPVEVVVVPGGFGILPAESPYKG
jgi:hypothetical protein